MVYVHVKLAFYTLIIILMIVLGPEEPPHKLSLQCINSYVYSHNYICTNINRDAEFS